MIIHEFEQYSNSWWAIRLGKPTASKAKTLVTSKGEPSKSLNGYAVELAYNLFAGKELDKWEGNDATERGSLLEAEAREIYQFTSDDEVKEVGFITDDDNLYGVSPDSLVGDDGGLEIKCQQAKGHTETLLYFNKFGKIPPAHIPQVQMCLMTTERKFWDLLHYHPDLPLLKVRVLPDDKVINQLKSQLANVIKERDRIIEVLNNA